MKPQQNQPKTSQNQPRINRELFESSLPILPADPPCLRIPPAYRSPLPADPPPADPPMKKPAERLDPREPSLSFNMTHKFSSTNNSFNLKDTAASTIKTAYDYLKASYRKLTSENSSILTASVKQTVPAASVEVSQIKDNQIGMTSEDHHPVGHAASEKSASLSTTSIKVSQPYPANSALMPSSVTEVPAIPVSMVTSRASATSTLVPSSVSEVPTIPASLVTSRALSQCIDHQQQWRRQRRRRRRR